MDEYDPFAMMFCQQEQNNVETKAEIPNEEDSRYSNGIKQECTTDDESGYEMTQEDASYNVKSENVEIPMSQFSDSFIEDVENDSKEAVVKKVRGRPKGSVNKQENRSRDTVKKPNVVARTKLNVENNTTLPKMRQNVHNIKLKQEQIEELKKSKATFFQPGVCFRIAPELDNCKECKKVLLKKNRGRRSYHSRNSEVDCRFYQFRKLRYNDDGLEVVGFLDPHSDPIDVDRNIWLPHLEKRVKTLSPQNARFILIHVGEQLCDLIEKEQIYYEKYKSDEKPVIWKRLIEGVIELCDLCSTTLFNYHFICTKCGLSLCIDCVSESENGKFDISCSTKDRDAHSFEDLSLTQIIVGDCLDALKKSYHEACRLWDIDHECASMKIKTSSDHATTFLAKNLLHEMKHGVSIVARELIPKTTSVDVEISKFKIESPEPNIHLDEDYLKYFSKFRTSHHNQEHLKPIKHCTREKKENVLSISQTLSRASSHMLFPEVPHRWLCEGKLLRLLDPINQKNEAIFHEQWQRGQPVLISNILDHLNQELWVPQAFSSEFGDEISDFINCMNGNTVRNREISTFWDGFENVEKRLKDNEGKPMLLKLKDWPPDSDFKKIMPSRFEDIMKNLPLNNYTNRAGDLNIVKYLPSCFIHPDLGPKGYFAYGSPFFLKEGTTNLHLDVSDAVNVMCYIGFPRDKNHSIDEYVQQGFRALLEADCDHANLNRVMEGGEVPGAIWHIFQAVDADRIRDFLLKIAQERGFEVLRDHDVIHDQNFYLDGELRARLFKEYNVKGYAIAQCLGDCIILPAGTPHQVRNIYSCIKIAEDFVSPQQVAHCLSLSNQFRKLTKTHTNNEEKLNIKNVAYHSVKEALASLQHLMWKRN